MISLLAVVSVFKASRKKAERTCAGPAIIQQVSPRPGVTPLPPNPVRPTADALRSLHEPSPAAPKMPKRWRPPPQGLRRWHEASREKASVPSQAECKPKQAGIGLILLVKNTLNKRHSRGILGYGSFSSLALPALIVCLCPPSWGQRGGSEVHLEVKDPSGAAVAATGKLENLCHRRKSQF